VDAAGDVVADGLLVAALVVQAAGIALPALVGGTAAGLVSAVPFGATFLGVSTLALASGAHLGLPRSVALLTAAYSVGQILGTLVVAPLLHHGYRPALLRIGFPHHLVVEGHTAGAGRREWSKDADALVPHSAN
jgi:hypothetical protein